MLPILLNDVGLPCAPKTTLSLQRNLNLLAERTHNFRYTAQIIFLNDVGLPCVAAPSHINHKS